LDQLHSPKSARQPILDHLARYKAKGDARLDQQEGPPQPSEPPNGDIGRGNTNGAAGEHLTNPAADGAGGEQRWVNDWNQGVPLFHGGGVPTSDMGAGKTQSPPPKSFEDLVEESSGIFMKKLNLMEEIETAENELNSVSNLPGSSAVERETLVDVMKQDIDSLYDQLQAVDPKNLGSQTGAQQLDFDAQRQVEAEQAWQDILAGPRIGGGGRPVDPPAPSSTTGDESERVIVRSEHTPLEINDVAIRDSTTSSAARTIQLRELRISQLIDPPRKHFHG